MPTHSAFCRTESRRLPGPGRVRAGAALLGALVVLGAGCSTSDGDDNAAAGESSRTTTTSITATSSTAPADSAGARASASASEPLTLVWVGTGEAYRFENGEPVRNEVTDYEFEVVQERDGRRWSSAKNLRFTSPEYDGRGGDRLQRLTFDLAYQAPAGDEVAATVTSNLGSGAVTSDVEFRDMSLTIALAEPTPLYDTFRITQRYDYEAGVLTETVDLMQSGPDGELTPVFRNLERATVYAASTFGEAPTRAA